VVKQSENVAHNEIVGGGQTSLHSHPGGGGGLVDKGGVTHTGVNSEVGIVFGTVYGDTNYFILLTPEYPGDGTFAMVKQGTKSVSGFTIMTYDDGGKAEPNVYVYWATGPYSNP